MHPDFWLDRWSSSQIGFHQALVAPSLAANWASLGFDNGGRVFVPLCGKSLDLLLLLGQGHEVWGVELSTIASEAIFSKNGVAARRRPLPSCDRYEAPGLTLLRGDFFKLTSSMLGTVSAVYGRAALISWPPESRAAYVAQLTALAPAASVLLIALEYPQSERNRPPFSLSSQEIEALFSAKYRVRQVERRVVLGDGPKMPCRGVSALFEVCYMLTRKKVI